MSDYSSTPLHRKLGIRDGSSVALLNPPPGFFELLESVSVALTDDAADADVVMLFAADAGEIADRFPGLSESIQPDASIWVAWPKKRSAVPTDVTFGRVQSIGLAGGLVDKKSCAIDATWQAVRFVVRLADRPERRARRPARSPSTGR